MHALFSKAALGAASVALGGLMVAPTEASASQTCYDETFTLAASGYTPTEFSLNNGVNWYPAWSVAPYPAYSIIPGTTYINYNQDTSGYEQAWAQYRTNFTVPSMPYGQWLDWDKLTVQVHADNVAYVYLDGYRVLSQPWAEDMSHFQGAPDQYDEIFPTHGAHSLRFEVFNFSGPTGLDYKVLYERRVCQFCDPRRVQCGPL
jgi:hypothetical protein